MKNITSRSDKICKILKETYPHVKTQLCHKNPFELLVATILSAQCTDKQVNSVTPKLFKELPTPRDFIHAPLEKIEKLIHATGFFRNKAKHLKNCARVLMEEYNGDVPKDLDELLILPGVGRKTANVVRGAAFDIPAVVVDTHVKRISKRLGLTAHTEPVKIEFDLMEIIPQKDWNDFGLHLIYLGREFCKARKPDCQPCPLNRVCEFQENS